MANYIIPPALKKGDKVIIISPSGNADPQFIQGAKSVLENWGLNASISTHADGVYGRYSGTVEDRLSDLQMAMDDDSTKMILCSRGGYGVVQLLDKVNFERIKKHPKWLVGYSDITALHLAFMSEGLASLHAPMARHLAEDSTDEASLLLKQTLFSGKQQYKEPGHLLNRSGHVAGTLFGGNLAVLSGLIGTPYLTEPKDGILFIEDIAESPYKIDRMMWSLRLSGILSQLKGLIVGRFAECEEDSSMGRTIYESIREMVEMYDYPVAFDFPVGHIKENYSLMQGVRYELKVERECVILETEHPIV